MNRFIYFKFNLILYIYLFPPFPLFPDLGKSVALPDAVDFFIGVDVGKGGNSPCFCCLVIMPISSGEKSNTSGDTLVDAVADLKTSPNLLEENGFEKEPTYDKADDITPCLCGAYTGMSCNSC